MSIFTDRVDNMRLYYSIDDNQIRAVGPAFECLGKTGAAGRAGFGDSLQGAYMDYYKSVCPELDLNECRSWELEWAYQVLKNRGQWND